MCPVSPPRLHLLLVAALLALVSGCHLAPSRRERIRGESPDSALVLTQVPKLAGEPAASSPQETTSGPSPAKEDPNSLLPDWVIDPSPGGIAGAVGIAAKRDRGIREQVEEARLSGRMELASMFEVRLQRVGRNEIEENDRLTGPGGDRNLRRNLVTVDRDLVDLVIAGSRQRALWIHPESGDCYVWMVLDAKILDTEEQAIVEGVSVLRATRRSPARPPDVPAEPLPEAAPPHPKSPPEKIEDNLKPVKTIPL